MHVALGGWFAGLDVGSAQYTDHLHGALLAASGPTDRFELIAPGGRRGRVHKLLHEQVTLPYRARRADVLHVPYWGPPLHAPVATVVTVHDLIPLLLPEYRQRWLWRAYTALVAAATRRAAAIIADSHFTASDLRRHLAIDERRVHVIPLGVEARFMAPALRPPPTVVRELPRYGLYVGGFDARKNLAVLFTAWRSVHAATGVPLVVAGQLPDRDSALSPAPRRLADQARLSESAVRFIGRVTEAEKPALYRGADVFAFPSRYEGFGLPPLEALASGTPVVASNKASLPELVGEAGLLVDPDDPAAWATALRTVLTDEGTRGALAAAGRRRAAQFTWRKTAMRTRAVYESAAAAGGA